MFLNFLFQKEKKLKEKGLIPQQFYIMVVLVLEFQLKKILFKQKNLWMKMV